MVNGASLDEILRPDKCTTKATPEFRKEVETIHNCLLQLKEEPHETDHQLLGEITGRIYTLFGQWLLPHLTTYCNSVQDIPNESIKENMKFARRGYSYSSVSKNFMHFFNQSVDASNNIPYDPESTPLQFEHVFPRERKIQFKNMIFTLPFNWHFYFIRKEAIPFLKASFRILLDVKPPSGHFKWSYRATNRTETVRYKSENMVLKLLELLQWAYSANRIPILTLFTRIDAMILLRPMNDDPCPYNMLHHLKTGLLNYRATFLLKDNTRIHMNASPTPKKLPSTSVSLKKKSKTIQLRPVRQRKTSKRGRSSILSKSLSPTQKKSTHIDHSLVQQQQQSTDTELVSNQSSQDHNLRKNDTKKNQVTQSMRNRRRVSSSSSSISASLSLLSQSSARKNKSSKSKRKSSTLSKNSKESSTSTTTSSKSKKTVNGIVSSYYSSASSQRVSSRLRRSSSNSSSPLLTTSLSPSPSTSQKNWNHSLGSDSSLEMSLESLFERSTSRSKRSLFTSTSHSFSSAKRVRFYNTTAVPPYRNLKEIPDDFGYHETFEIYSDDEDEFY